MRMLTRLVPLAVLPLVAAVPLSAQEEGPEPPTVLMVSSYKCPQAAIQAISEAYDTYTRPVEEEIVERGTFANAGLFFHWWADEWNVNYYRTGYDLAEMMDAVAEINETVLERNPELEDEPGPFEQCSEHKDGIYTFGPGTNRTWPPPEMDG